MSYRPIYQGWDLPGRLSRQVRRRFAGIGLNRDLQSARQLMQAIAHRCATMGLDSAEGLAAFAKAATSAAVAQLGGDDGRFGRHLAGVLADLIAYEGWFTLPSPPTELSRSELWQLEDQLTRVDAILDHLDEVGDLAAAMLKAMVEPIVEQHPNLLVPPARDEASIAFQVDLCDEIRDLPAIVERVMHIPFAPELEPLALTRRLRARLEHNLIQASGGVPGDPDSMRMPKLPTRQLATTDGKVVATYLDATPLLGLFDYRLDITLPQATRFEHHHIVAGSGHGKTQTLQHLILHDLDAVAAGRASVIVIDSQSDLINNIAGLACFAPGSALHERLVLIDPTDLEWPVALNLFDVGRDRLQRYSRLERERLTNSILELYDFVLGSLLDAGMTQKQAVVFRYITRLLLHIPNATIHTLRELLEDGGYDRYRGYADRLGGSARAFFTQEFDGKEFSATKRQVLRRLYGILENQTFERMFSHPKSKLDLFSEMNAGKVILINTAKDLLKENGTEIFGRFFIAMIAQAAQERATLSPDRRLPTFVYIDEASDYFDRNIGTILSQARKYNVGIVLAHQFLGQLDPKLHEAIAANTAIKFAGGVSAKDARALANDLRTDTAFIEHQSRHAFAAFIKGQTDHAVAITIEPGRMERLPRLSAADQAQLRDIMRRRHAVHQSELEPLPEDPADHPEPPDTGEPMPWE